MVRVAKVSVGIVFAVYFMVFLALVLSFAMPAWRVNHVTARAPNDYFVEKSDADMVFLQDSFPLGDKETAYFVIEPIVGDLQVPGFDEVLNPGEVVISPILEANKDFITARFGKIIGTLSTDILLHPNEALLYARPLDGAAFIASADIDQETDTSPTSYAKGYGPEGRFLNGEIIYDRAKLLVPLVFVALIPPVLIFTIISFSFACQAVAKESYAFQIIGASKRRLWRLNLEYYGFAAFVGVLVGILFQLLFLTIDIPLPFVNFVVRAASLNPYIIIIILGDLFITLLLTVIFFKPNLGLSIKKKRTFNKEIKTFWVVLFGLGILATLVLSLIVILIPKIISESTFITTNLIGYTFIILGFSSTFVLVVAKVFARVVPRNVSTLEHLQYDWSAKNAYFITRSSVITGILLIIGLLFSGFYVAVSDSPWGKNYDLLKNKVAEVHISCRAGAECVDEVFAELKEKAPNAFIGTTLSGESSTGNWVNYRLDYGREYLKDDNLGPIMESYVPSGLPVADSSAKFSDQQFVTFYVANSNGLDINKIASIRLESVPDYPNISWIDQVNYIATLSYTYQSRWVLWLFTVTAFLTMSIITLVQALESQKFAHEVAGLVAMTQSERRMTIVLAKQNLIIVGISMLFSLVLGLHLAHSIVQTTVFDIPGMFISGLFLMLIVSTCVSFVVLRHSIISKSRMWLPGKNLL